MASDEPTHPPGHVMEPSCQSPIPSSLLADEGGRIPLVNLQARAMMYRLSKPSLRPSLNQGSPTSMTRRPYTNRSRLCDILRDALNIENDVFTQDDREDMALRRWAPGQD